jgi:hypothetical protein
MQAGIFFVLDLPEKILDFHRQAKWALSDNGRIKSALVD